MNTIDIIITKIIEYLQIYGIGFGMFMIVVESIIPILPLGVFVAFNMMAYGILKGFIFSYMSTIVGCLISFYLSKKLYIYLVKNKKENETFKKLCIKMRNIKFSTLVLIIALPFSPAFLINIAAGISKVDIRKFFFSLLIGKVSIIYFWGFISKSMLESIKDLNTVIRMSLILLVCFIVSKIINKKLKIE